MISLRILLVPNIHCHYLPLLTTTDSINSQLNQYICECHAAGANFSDVSVSPFKFWHDKCSTNCADSSGPVGITCFTGVCRTYLLCIRASFKWQDESYGRISGDEDMDESECWTTQRHWFCVILCHVSIVETEQWTDTELIGTSNCSKINSLCSVHCVDASGL